MQYKKALAEIQKDLFHPVYVIDSPELFFREELYHSLADRFLREDGADSLSCNGEESAPGDIINQLTTGSLFSTKKIIRVTSGFEFLCSAMDWFGEYVSACDSSRDIQNILFVEDDFSGYKKTKTRAAALKQLKKLNTPYDFLITTPAVKKYKLPSWLVSHASSRYGIKLGRTEAALIIENTGTVLKRLDMELDKIATFILPRTRVSSDDINQLCLFNRENTIFEMLDAVSAGKISTSLKHMNQLLITGSSPINGVYMMYWHLKRLAQASLKAREGKTEKEIVSEIGLNAYFKKKFFAQVKRFTPGQLQSAILLSQKADTLCKTGGDPERALERLIIVLCTVNSEAEEVSQLL